MPLRVAEKDGLIKAVNKCGECLFLEIIPYKENNITLTNIHCGHKNAKHKMALSGHSIPGDCIPVWCPLPEPTMRHTLKHI